MIRFRCPAEDCGKNLTVGDELAGRTGKCPACGTSLVVPQPTPAVVAVETAREMKPRSQWPPIPGPGDKPRPADLVGETWEEDTDVPSRPAGRAVSYGAIGLGWQLLRQEFGTWMLTTLVAVLVLGGVVAVLQAATVALLFGEYYLLGPHRFPFAMLLIVPVNIGIQGLVLGSLIRMALKQIDGGRIAVGDLFSLGGAGEAERLFKGMILVSVLGAVGSVFLVIPGLIVAALSMFTLHLIVDGRMGEGSALAASFRALRRHWLTAIFFYLATMLITSSGMLLLGVGLLVTLPWYMLTLTAQYRRSFAPGAKPRAAVVEDPYAEAIGIPEAERAIHRAPIGAWALMSFAIVAPAAAVALVISMMASLLEKGLDGKHPWAATKEDRPRVMTKGAAAPTAPGRNAGGIPGMAVQDAATALKGLEGGSAAQREACFWLSTHTTSVDEPLRPQIARELESLLGRPRDAQMAAEALVNWATIDNLPALAAASRSDNVRVSGPIKLALGRLRDAEGTEDRTRSDDAIGTGPVVVGPGGGKKFADLIEQERNAAPVDGVQITLAEARDGNADRRIKALTKLGKEPVDPTHRDEVASALVAMLADENSVIRANALAALAVWGRPDDERAMAALLDDKMAFVQTNALKALSRSKDPEIIARVITLLGKPGVDPRGVEEAIRRFGPLAEPALLDVLVNGDSRPRLLACRILGEVGTEKCLPDLRLAQEDNDRAVANFARNAVQALERRLGLPSSAPASPPRKNRSSTARRKARAGT